MGAGKRATQPWRIWISDYLLSVALTLAFGFIGGRLNVELSPLHLCHMLKGVPPPHHVFWRDTVSPTAILKILLVPSSFWQYDFAEFPTYASDTFCFVEE